MAGRPMSRKNDRDDAVKMDAPRYLGYVHASLADAARLSPDFKRESVLLSPDELAAGRLGEHAVKEVLKLAKALQRRSAAASADEDDRLWPIKVLICPRVYGRRPVHGIVSQRFPERISPLVLSVKVSKDGRLFDDETTTAPAIVPRELLEPCLTGVAIGTVDDADAAYATLSEERGTWVGLVNRGDDLLRKLTGDCLADLSIEGYLPIDNEPCAFVHDRSQYSFHVQRLVDLLRADDAPRVPLLEALMKRAPDRPLLNEEDQLSLSAHHVGQMECRYGLSASQRESLMHHLADGRNGGQDVLAVDGPPGTGKTTLLLSVIANLWVQRALDDGEPPIMAAVSTNRNAVVNILRAFAQVAEPAGPLAGRWLPAAQSYGLFLPSKHGAKSELSTTDFPLPQLTGEGRHAVFDARQYETLEGLDAGCSAFLASYGKAFDVAGKPNLADAVKKLRSRLGEESAAIRRIVDTLQALGDMIGTKPISSATVAGRLQERQRDHDQSTAALETASGIANASRSLHLRWSRHLDEEPWWVALLAALRLSGKRRRRDRLFCAQAEQDLGPAIAGSLHDAAEQTQIDSTVRNQVRVAVLAQHQAEQGLTLAKANLGRLQQLVETLRRVVPEPGDLTVETVQIALDMGHRFTAFKLTTHYWEGRFLLEVQDHLNRYANVEDSKAADRLERQYRRLAKLHPCFVTTLQTLPNRFIGYKAVEQPMFNLIDLLIVDEAGQIPPEIGAPAFALAKRALVVGDVDQIEPIWSVPAAVDSANARRFKLVEAKAALDAFHEAGLSASSGNLMRMAQRATPYTKHPKRGRGMFLSEHRRCWPEIIRMCNVLVYQGLLQPCRDEGSRRILPSVGYAHIPGTDRTINFSRENITEAHAIAQWLKLRREEIETAFAADKKTFGQLVMVIAPFGAQKWALKRALDRELGPRHGVTVDTLHAMQGTERRVVIFSPTYGLNTQPGSTFFDRNRSMLNVAISRAQDAFLVMGNMHLFNPAGSHPSAVIGRMLFGDGSNEVPDVPAKLLVPGYDMRAGVLISDLDGHREALREALEAARGRVVIVSPFLTSAAIAADDVAVRISRAAARGVRVRVISDTGLNEKKRHEFQQCVKVLENAGAVVSLVQSQGVHSKMVLVDRSWLVVGSFNWLSAARDRSSEWMRYESSIRYDGVEAFQMISKSLGDLKEIIQAQ